MPSQRQPPPRRTIDDLVAASRARIERFDPGEALRAATDGALLVDTRSAEDRRVSGVIPGSVAVPLSVLYWRLDPASAFHNPDLADLARPVILVCAHGYSSSIAAATLRDLGFERAGDVIGGFEAWAEAGLPIQPAD